MKTVRCKSTDFRKTVVTLAGNARQDVNRNMRLSIIDAGNTCKDEVVAKAPRDTGQYAEGWTVEVDERPDLIIATVRNTGPHRQIAHLLEFGHEQFYMGRDLGYRTPGVKHVGPAYSKAKAQLLRRWGR